jgi:hypothetical protein
VRSWIAVRGAAPGLAALGGGIEIVAAGEWTLAIGRLELHEPEMLELSARFGEAQAFFVDVERGAYAWTRAVGGRLVRGVAIVRGQIWADGEPAPEEPADLRDVCERTIDAIARAWSVHPEDVA